VAVRDSSIEDHWGSLRDTYMNSSTRPWEGLVTADWVTSRACGLTSHDAGEEQARVSLSLMGTLHGNFT